MDHEPRTVNVGVISDTHGHLRPEAIRALSGSDIIIHAGDVGSATVLERLRAMAPTTAVRGNVDGDAWASVLPETDVVNVGDLHFYVIHQAARLRIDPKRAGFAAVISGHTHRPRAETRDGVLYLNPGSAGPRRFSLPITVAKIQVTGTHLSHEIVELTIETV